MKNSDVKLIERKTLLKTRWKQVDEITVQPQSLSGEGYAKPLSREVTIIDDAVFCLPYIPETDEVLLNQQFRIGAYVAGEENPYLFECCGGGIEKGENPELALKREMIEETGCELLDFEFIGHAYSSVGGSSQKFIFYCGRIAKPQTGLFGLEEEGEEIKTHIIKTDTALEMLANDEITNITGSLPLHWLAYNRERLQKKWNKK